MEVASAFQEVFELRLALAEDRLEAVGSGGASGAARLKPAEVVAINEAADGALQAYAHLAQCFDDPRLPRAPADWRADLGAGAGAAAPKPLATAGPLDAGSAEAYLTAHFCSARILARRLAPSREERLRDQRAALARWHFVIEAAPKVAPTAAGGGGGGGGAAGFFSAELGICRQMAALMPEKIALIERGGRDVLAPGQGAKLAALRQ